MASENRNFRVQGGPCPNFNPLLMKQLKKVGGR